MRKKLIKLSPVIVLYISAITIPYYVYANPAIPSSVGAGRIITKEKITSVHDIKVNISYSPSNLASAA